MARPEPIDINDLVQSHLGRFARHELWVSDSLAEYLSEQKGTSLAYTTVVVDTDDDSPVKKIQEDQIFLNVHGRFYPPETDKDGSPLGVSLDDWRELIQSWFSDNNFEVDLPEGDPDLIRFTFGYPAIEISPKLTEEASEEAPEEEPSEDFSEEPGEEEPIEEETEELPPEEEEPLE